MVPTTDKAAESGLQETMDTKIVSGRKRRVVLSQEERYGLHRILSDPETPTESLQTALAEYRKFIGQTD